MRWIVLAGAVNALLTFAGPARALDGVSVTNHFEGSVDWTIGGFGSIWRHDLIESEVVARRKLYDGQARMAVLSRDGSRVAFLRQGDGAILVATIGGARLVEVAVAHEHATLDWPDTDTVYFNFGGWYSPAGSRTVYRVNVDSGETGLVVQWDHPVWRFHLANDAVRGVVRPTGGSTDGTIVTYTLPGDGSFDPARATDSPSCGAAIDPLGHYFLDGMSGHQGLDVRDWETLAIVQSLVHEEMTTRWGGPDSGTYHNRNGWSVNSQDWISAHIGWGIAPTVGVPRGGNQVLYNWRPGFEARIVVTSNQENSHAYDSAGDFWEGTPPVPAPVGLRAAWLFDAAALALDSTGHHNLVNAGATIAAGVEHGAARLSGGTHLRLADAHLASGAPWKLADGRPAMTVSGWFRRGRSGARQPLLSKAGSFAVVLLPGAGADRLCAELARYPHNTTAAEEQVSRYCTPDLVGEDWTFFAVTLSESRELRLYLWGASAGDWLARDLVWRVTEPPLFTGSDLVLGCGDWDGAAFCLQGSIDRWLLFDRALPAAEIESLVAPPACASSCCSAGELCSSVRPGSGCADGAICCATGACAPPACGDGACSRGETCTGDACCAGTPFDDGVATCCNEAITTGTCCDNLDCAAAELCIDNECMLPTLPARIYWALDANALTVDGAGDHTLTNYGAVAGAGKRGGGAVFAGDQMLVIADTDLDAGVPLASDGLATFTLTGWVRRVREGSRQYLMQKGGATSADLSLGVFIASGDELCAELGGPGGTRALEVCTFQRLRADRWVFFSVALDRDGHAEVHLWDDEAAAWLLPGATGELAVPLHLGAGALRLGIGESGGSNHGLAGTLDEVRLYDYAMTFAAIEEQRARDASGSNSAPQVDAGSDQVGVTESGVLGVDATVSDANGDPFTTHWSLASGPGTALVLLPERVVTPVAFDALGDYVFELTADDGLATGSDEVMVTVTSLPVVDLARPIGGEVWRVGEVQPIEWTAERVGDVTIRYSTDGGQSWSLVSQSTDDSAPEWGRYPWVVPDEPSDDCRVRLEGYFIASAVSVSRPFAIRRPVTEPEGRGCSASQPCALAAALVALTRKILRRGRFRRRSNEPIDIE